MSFGDNLKNARKRLGLTQKQVAAALDITESTYCGYETGKREPDVQKIKQLARVLNTPSDALLGTVMFPQNAELLPGIQMLPRLGQIACGTPILAEQNIAAMDAIPDWVNADFTLVCKGDSMVGAHIRDGDVVCIRRQEEVENGQIAAVLVDDETESGSATLKRVRYIEGGVALWPENPAYEPLVFYGTDANRVHVLGLATHFISAVR